MNRNLYGHVNASSTLVYKYVTFLLSFKFIFLSNYREFNTVIFNSPIQRVMVITKKCALLALVIIEFDRNLIKVYFSRYVHLDFSTNETQEPSNEQCWSFSSSSFAF